MKCDGFVRGADGQQLGHGVAEAVAVTGIDAVEDAGVTSSDYRGDGDLVADVCFFVEKSANPLHERGGGGVFRYGSGPFGGLQDDGTDLDPGALRNGAVR